MATQTAGISRAHEALLRLVADNEESLEDVLAHPERVLGNNAAEVLRFWRHLDAMTARQWDLAEASAKEFAGDGAHNAGGGLGLAGPAPTAGAIGAREASAAARLSGETLGAVWAASWATYEIQRQRPETRDERHEPFYPSIFRFKRRI